MTRLMSVFAVSDQDWMMGKPGDEARLFNPVPRP